MLRSVIGINVCNILHSMLRNKIYKKSEIPSTYINDDRQLYKYKNKTKNYSSINYEPCNVII